MERSEGKLLDGDRRLPEGIEESITMKEWPGIPEWRGRLWLPDSGQARPGGKNCLIPDGSEARPLFAESFAPGAIGAHVAPPKGHTPFE